MLPVIYTLNVKMKDTIYLRFNNKRDYFSKHLSTHVVKALKMIDSGFFSGIHLLFPSALLLNFLPLNNDTF